MPSEKTVSCLNALLVLLAIPVATAMSQSLARQAADADVLVYGGTLSGIAASVSAAKGGHSVLLVEPTDRIGGLVTSGLSYTDFRSFESLTGFYFDFSRRVQTYYEDRYGKDSEPAKAAFRGTHGEPSVNLRALKAMLAEHPKITVLRQHEIAGVETSDFVRGRQRIVSARFRAARQLVTLEARVFIDASYEGDLMALAGEPYHVGRESRDQYGEPMAGNAQGQADGQVQGYNLRLIMTTDRSNIRETPAPNERHVGTQRPGFSGVLHTWGRDLNYHPHVHYLVAGGGLNEDATEWKPSRPNYFVPDTALATVFRAKLRDEFKTRGLYDQVDPAAWQRTFIVDCKAVGDGRGTLKYLAAYVFRVAVTERRITHCNWHPDMDRATVTLMVKRSGTEKYRPMELSVTEFIRRYLQHVLPSGFHKVRHYGFLSSTSRVPLLLIRWLVALSNNDVMELCRTEVLVTPPRPPLTCPSCGGVMICTEIVLPTGRRIRPPPATLPRVSAVPGGLPC